MVLYGATRSRGATPCPATSSTGATSRSPWCRTNGTTSTASGPAPPPSFRTAASLSSTPAPPTSRSRCSASPCRPTPTTRC
uniref:Similar to vacuolar invertase 2, GIN2 n=1 Tax=Arundo donax TaxID=35708 RepID=A0A0A9FDJ7_ARUDO